MNLFRNPEDRFSRDRAHIRETNKAAKNKDGAADPVLFSPDAKSRFSHDVAHYDKIFIQQAL